MAPKHDKKITLQTLHGHGHHPVKPFIPVKDVDPPSTRFAVLENTVWQKANILSVKTGQHRKQNQEKQS